MGKMLKRAALFAVILALFFVVSRPMGTCTAQAAEGVQGESDETVSEDSGDGTEVLNGGLTTEDFRVRAVPGLNGYYKQGAPVPLTLYLESLKEDFEGIIRVIVSGSAYGSGAVAYEKDIMLTAGEEKMVSMPVDNMYGMSLMKLELVNSSGKVVLEYDIKTRSQANENVLVGILSSDFTALNYFDGKNLDFSNYTVPTQIVELDADTFPDQTSSLEALSYLIINSFDTSVLNEAQYAALKGWVENGGILILGTGSDYRQTLSGFQDGFINGDIGAFQSGEFRLAGSEDAVSFSENDGVVSLSLGEGSTLEGVLGTSELIWKQEIGQGNVVMTAFNLGMEPVSSWAEKGEMAKSLLTSAASGYSIQRMQNLNYGNSTDSWEISNAVDNMHQVSEPNMLLLGILFAAFVFFAGPGLYLILKAADKREWMWGIVPALSIVVTAGVFLLSRDMRINAPQEASVTSLCYDSGKDSISRKVYMGIQVPGASEEEVALNENLHNLKVLDDYGHYTWYGAYGMETDNYNYKTAVREQAEGYRLRIKNGSTFESSYMTAEYTENTAEEFGLETSVSKSVSGIRGTVTNHTECDLKGVSVYTDSYMVILDELKAGESKSFEESDNQFFKPGYTDFYSYHFDSIGDDTDTQEQLASIWNLFSNEYMGSADAATVYTFGWIPEWKADYVVDEKVEEAKTAMIIRQDQAVYEDYLDAEAVTLFPYTVGSPNNWDMDGWMYDSEVEVSFDIGSVMTDVYALIRAEDNMSAWGNTGNVTVYGYNLQTEEYDELFTAGNVMEFSDGCPYIDENGVIRMKFTSSLVDETDYAPEITAIGGGY